MNAKPQFLDSPVFAAFITGLYLAVFFVTNNLSMLPVSSIVLIGIAFITPITLIVAVIAAVLHKLDKKAATAPVTIFVCTMYLAAALVDPILGLGFIQENFNVQISALSTVARFSYVAVALILAASFGFMFRQYTRIFTIALSVMTFAAIASNINFIAKELFSTDAMAAYETAEILDKIPLQNKPDIYFILADGYGSIAYLNQNGIDISGFKNFLDSSGFRSYDEVFSNYQTTTASMSAMLNMEHHYYASTRKFSEIGKVGRYVIGGNNNLVRYLKANNYQIEYIHQGSYLLLHGCGADHCYPDLPFAGAKTVIRHAIPGFLRFGMFWDKRSLDDVQQDVIRLLQAEKTSGDARFQYIHLYRPSHTPNIQMGSCDQVEQLKLYSERVAAINTYLQALVTDIISRDPEAVVVIAGDHGPFIFRQCSRNTDLNQLADYRDRAGVMTAIRWPKEYDGKYDNQISTSINLFKYILASLAENSDEFISTLAADDVYIHGSEDVLKIVGNGKILIPPEHYSFAALARINNR